MDQRSLDFVWSVLAGFRPQAEEDQAARTWSQRFLYMLPLVAAWSLLVRSEARYGWLGTRFVPANPAVQWTRVLLTAAGVAASMSAPRELWFNWRGVVPLQEGP